MFDRFERPVKIVCLGLAVLLAWQLGGLILGGDPLAHLKIPALPVLPGETNELAKVDQKETNTAPVAKTATNGTNMVKGPNLAGSTNASKAGETGQTNAGSAPKPALPPGMTPEMMAGLPPEIMAQIMSGGMPGGPMGGMKKMDLPPEVQARVDKIVESEFFGPVVRMPMELLGIADQEAFIQATNGQSGPVKIGGQMAGIKLLRIGINRVLIEQDGEKKELTLFGGIGGTSLMPKPANAPSTNAPAKMQTATNQSLSSKQ